MSDEKELDAGRQYAVEQAEGVEIDYGSRLFGTLPYEKYMEIRRYETYLETANAFDEHQEQLFDQYCASLGARDIFSLFHIKYGEGYLSDYIRAEHGDLFSTKLTRYFLKTDPGHATVITDPAHPKIELHDDSIFTQIKTYFRNYSIVETEAKEVYMPVFCAHPANINNSKFKVTTTSQDSRSIGFNITVPGLSGGFGVEKGLEKTLRDEELDVSYQLQVRVNAVFHTWMGKAGKRHTFCPVEITGTREVDKNYPNLYIDYCSDNKEHQLGHPHEICKTGGTWHQSKIKSGSTDFFEISIPFMGSEALLNVKSVTAQEFAVEHYLFPNHKYIFRGIGDPCHDYYLQGEAIDCDSL